MKKLKEIFTTRNIYLLLACMLLAVLSAYQSDRNAQEYAASQSTTETPTEPVDVAAP